ncbi:uncharacterized protein LOC132853721 [Tachysurus vachellii]|uniref:uncharacterized protein LOC132853721 n=1 Tax=Tachysurus vachellii TaxID=175792 RepID=UPI00296B2C56|nr:uncharacterized protein LOC132853721 [Tachysurus vachellii]
MFSSANCQLQKFSDDSAIISLITDDDDREYRGPIQNFVDWCQWSCLQLNVGKTKEMVVDFYDTTVVGLIEGNDETAYREEIQHLVAWCDDNNLELNTKKTKEVIVDFRRAGNHTHPPIHINRTAAERVPSFKFLGIHIAEDLSWSLNSSILIRKAQQCLYFLRRLKKSRLCYRILENFYRCTIESILTNCISVWYSSCTASGRKALQRVVKTAQQIIGSHVYRHCTEFVSTTCVPCVDSFTSEPTDLLQCFSCAVCDSGQGLQVKTACTRISDTVCEPLEGLYCTNYEKGSCTQAVEHTQCSPGQYIKQKGTAREDAECAECKNGTYSDGSLEMCKLHTKCEDLGLEAIKPGTMISDVECGNKINLVALIVGIIVFIAVVAVVVVLFVKIRHEFSRRSDWNAEKERGTKTELNLQNRRSGHEVNMLSSLGI